MCASPTKELRPTQAYSVPQAHECYTVNATENVLVFRSELLPISETFIEAQMAALRNYRPTLVGLRRAAHSLPLSQGAIIASENGIRLAAEMRIGMHRLLGFGSGLSSASKHLQPRLLHAHFSTDAVHALHIARSLRVPLVVTLHGFDVTTHDSAWQSTLAGRLYLAKRERLWRQATTFLCVSDFIRQKAIETGFPAEKLQVHHIGIDVRKFTQRAAVPAQPLVLFVGRLVEKKGCEYMLRAMDLVRSRVNTAQTVIIGDGPLRASLEQLSKSLALRCAFLGAQPSGVVRDWLSKASVVCVPSVTARNGDSEGLPIVTLESQAMGVPVVGFRHAGIPEGVRDLETGLLADEKDVSSLADNIVRYLSDASFRERSGQTAASWVRQKFDIVRQTEQLEEIYDATIGRATRR